MTVGIAAVGRNAGIGVYRALELIERAGEGCIRGFAVYRVITQDGKMFTYTTQRGGTTTLVTMGERTGCLPPVEVLEANVAALISSGPDRPEPLDRFLPGDPGVGLVTGHRIPVAPTKNGIPLNERALQLMREGVTAPEAVDSLMTEHPHIDAGIIAVDMKGNIGMRNSERVMSRLDVAEVFRENASEGHKVAVLLNDIHPRELAMSAAARCLHVMEGEREPDFWITVRAGLQVTSSDEEAVFVDENLVAQGLAIVEPDMLIGEQVGAVPYMNCRVLGPDSRVRGYVMSEPLTTLSSGVIIDMGGMKTIEIPVKKSKCSRGLL